MEESARYRGRSEGEAGVNEAELVVFEGEGSERGSCLGCWLGMEIG